MPVPIRYQSHGLAHLVSIAPQLDSFLTRSLNRRACIGIVGIFAFFFHVGFDQVFPFHA
jgi:hypothetical protein